MTLRADHRSAGLTRALEAAAVTTGPTIHFAPGQYRPDQRRGQARLFHELAHVRQRPEPGVVFRRDGRTRQYRVEVRHPEILLFPTDASREDIAETLFENPNATGNFIFVATTSTDPVEGVVPRGVRPRPMSALPEAPMSVIRWAADKALEPDVERTISILKQGLIGDADEWALAELCLRWSQYSEIPTADGGHYFDRYLSALDRRSLTEWGLFSDTTRTGLEWLLIETEGKSEQVKKAIESRSTTFAGRTGYVITDGSPHLNRGDVVGRFYWSTGSGAQVRITAWVGNVPMEDAAVPLIRREFFVGGRTVTGMEIGVIVPQQNGGGFDAYVAAFPLLDPLVTPPIEDPEGSFYWYPPGTRLVSSRNIWDQTIRDQFADDVRGQSTERQVDLVQLEAMTTALRVEHGAGLYSPTTIEAWQAADRSMIVLVGQLQAAARSDDPDAAPVGVEPAPFESLFEAVRTEVRHLDEHVVAKNYHRVDNPVLTPGSHHRFGRTLRNADTFGEWREVLGQYLDLSRAMDAHLVEYLRGEGLGQEAEQLEIASRIAGELNTQLVDQPDGQKIRAVFYPLDQLTSDVSGMAIPEARSITLYFYIYRRGETWHLIDLTTAAATGPIEADGGTETLPPSTLFEKLNTRLKFPRGRLYWELPNGVIWQMTTTAEMSTSEWLTAIGMGLAVVGLTIGTGGVATTLFIASGLVGAAAAAYDLKERSEAGVLTEADVVVNVASIVGSLASAGAVGTGRIIATSAGRTGAAARAAVALDGRVYLPLVGTSLVAEGVTMIVGIEEALEAYRRASARGGDADGLALTRLVGQLLLTGGLSLLAIKGDVADFRRGRNLYLDPDFGDDVMARAVLSETELQDLVRGLPGIANPDEVARLFARTDIDGDLALRLRADLTQALRDGVIDTTSLQRKLSGMRGAADIHGLRQELAELRAANRVSAAGALDARSSVHISVRGPVDLGDGGPVVRIDPVDEADLVFRGRDGRVHLHETKHRINALRAKGPKQIENMRQWLDADPDGRAIRVTVDSESGWTGMFRPPSIMTALMDNDITLHIAGATWSPAKMQQIWDAVESHARSTGRYPPTQEFFDEIATFDQAESVLGISMR